MKHVLVTGSAGFVGSHFVRHVLQKTDWKVTGLDSFRHRGDSLRITPDLDPNRYTIHTCDLAAPISHRLADKIGPVDLIVNFASDSHVERSIEDPVPFVQNNVNLALHMLEYARKAKPKAFVQISTDEVYGAAPAGVNHSEWDKLLPSNPYSASKAAQEALAIAYWRTYGVPVIISNTMNIFGEMQDREKFIPMVISRIAKGEPVTVHGSPGNIGSRFYLHARNQADAILWILQNQEPVLYEDGKADCLPLRFNVVGNIEMDNLEVAKTIAHLMGKPLQYKFEDFHMTRPGHDRRYSLDGSRLAKAGWKAPHSFEDSIKRTIEWTLAHTEWMK